MIYIQANGKIQKIGYQTENNRTQVIFDLSDIFEEFPGGLATLVIQRPGDDDGMAYPATAVEMDGTDLIWTVTAYDIEIRGKLKAQVIYTVGEVVAKTKIYHFDVDKSLTAGPNPPSGWQDWMIELLKAAAQTQAAIDAYDEMTATATGLAAGSDPTASIDHSGDHPVLNLGIPKGDKGNKGDKGDKGDPGNATIDDTAGAGDTTKVWSADKTNSELSTVKNAINYLSYGNAMVSAVWSQGGYANLSEDPPTSINTGSTRIRTCVSVTAKEKVTMECLSGFKYCYSVYVDNIRKDYNASWTTGNSTKELEYGTGTYTIYISFAKSDNASITPDEATDGLKITADNGMSDVPGEIRATQAALEAAIVETKDSINDAFPGNPMFTLQWLLGGYSNLSDDPPVNFNTGNTRARLKVVVNVKSKLTVSCASGYKYLYSVYKGDTRQTYESVSWSTDAEKDFEYGEGTYTLYMNCANTSNTDLTADEAKAAITILADNAVLNIYNAIGAIKETKNLYDPGANNTLRGYYNASNTWVTSYDFGQTDFIHVKQNTQYISALLETPVLWFDENKDFLSSTASNGYNGWITPPTGASYVKFMIRTSEHTSFYVYSNEPDSVQVPLNVIPYGLYNQYSGKKAVAFGTSLTYRAKSSGGYLEYLPEMAQMTVDNQGLGNSTILEHQEHTDMMGMITGYTGYADKDVVLLEGFVNDWYDNSDKLGTWEDEGVITSTTVCGRIRYAINYILTQNPHTTLIIILDPYGQAYNGNPGCASTVVKSGYTQMEYYDEIAKLAASLGIPTIKGYAISGMNELVSDYYIDIIHPSPLGAKQFADVIWAEMQRIPIKMK